MKTRGHRVRRVTRTKTIRLHALLYKYVVVFGSVWSDLLVLHNYCVIISGCQKVTFWGVEAKKFGRKNGKNQSCLKLPDSARKFIENLLVNPKSHFLTFGNDHTVNVQY